MRSRALGPALLLLLVPCAAFPQAADALIEVVAGAPGTELVLQAPGVERRVRTDARGRGVFPHVRAGRYHLRSEGPPPLSCALDVPPGARLRLALCDQKPSDREEAGRLFDARDLRGLPRPANVWSLLGEVPGVVVDRVDVGGSETALQSLLVTRGDAGAGATWTLDGADVTDPAALGATLVFADLPMLEAVRVRTSTTDVRVRTPGVQVALLLPEGKDRASGRAHLRGAFDGLQADNLPDSLQGRPFFRNRVERVLDGGAELGGPVAGGRAWLWGAASQSRLRQQAFTEHAEELSATSFAAKARTHFGGTHLELLALRNEKRHQDRDTGFSSAPEARWLQSGPAHLVSLEAQRPLGRVSLLGRVSWFDAGFRFDPRGGTQATAYEDFAGVFRNSYYTFSTRRPRLQAGFEAATAARAWGFDHQLLLGAAYARSTVRTDLTWPGNKVLGLERQSVFFRTFQLTGFALPTRDQSARSLQEEAAVYAQDTLRRGRFTFDLGLRLDHLRGRNLASSVGANPEFPDLLPAVAYAGGPARIRWTDLLPRAGASWDVHGDGRSRLQVAYARYAAALSASDVVFDNPLGRDPASLTYYWRDLDGDHVVDRGELDLLRGAVGSSGIDPQRPGAAKSPHVIADGMQAPLTDELRAAAARAVGLRLRLSLDAAWRRTTELRWAPLRDLALADYVIRGAVLGELFGDPYSVGYYAPASESRIVSGNGRVLENRPRYRQDAVTVALAADGHWGARVEARAWAAFTDWREFFLDRALAIQDPTPLDNEPLVDVGPVAARGSGLGRADVFVNARWTGGATVRVLLPARVRAAARLQAREGFPIPYFQVASTGDPTAGAKNVLVADRLDQYRLPALVLLDVRLERGFAAGPGVLSLGVDAFNVLNRSTTLQIARDVELPAFNRPREILRPRILRVGIEYQF